MVAGAPVAARRGDDGRPVVAPDGHRVPGHAVVGRPRESRSPLGPGRVQDALDHLGADVGQVDEGDEREVVVARPEVGQPGPQRGAHPLVPVVGVHDLRPRALDERRDLVAGGADDDDHAVAPARDHPGHGRLHEGRPTVGEPHEGLRAAHPAAGPGGEHEPDGGHGASLPRAAGSSSGGAVVARGSWVFA